MKRPRFGPALVVATALVAGCSPNFHNGNLKCAASGPACPPNFHCASDKTCWQDGQDPAGDMASDLSVQMDGGMDAGRDLAAADLTTVDLTPPMDLAPIQFPPAAVWISSGGGSPVGPATQRELNLSIGGSSTVGTVTGSASGRSFTSGFFCEDSIQ